MSAKAFIYINSRVKATLKNRPPDEIAGLPKKGIFKFSHQPL